MYLASASRVKTDGRFLNEDRVNRMHEKILALNEIAKKRGQTLSEMALAWILKDDVITSVLAGASRPAQILSNIRALDNIEFSDEELEAIDRISK